MKIYIAGPMSGYADHNKPAFIETEQFLREAGYETFNPINHEASIRTQAGDISGQEAYRECLLIDLSWICMHADAIYMMKGWEKSYGSKAEHATAVALGLRIIYEND